MFHIRLHHHTTLQSIYAFILSQHPLLHLTSHPHNWKIPLTTRTQAMFWFWAMYQILPTFQFTQKNECLCLRCFQSQIYFRTDWIDILLKMLTIYLYEVGIIRERVVMALATDVDRRVILHRFWIAPRYQLPTQTSLSIAIASNSWLFSIQYLCVNLKKFDFSAFLCWCSFSDICDAFLI